MIAEDLRKQQVLGADPRAIQQINFTANLDRAEDTTMLFVIEETKETVFGFSQRTAKVLWMQFYSSVIWCLSIKNNTIQQFKCKAIKFTA